jgi:protein-disulfide isomerase
VFLALAVGCGNDGGQVEASAQATPTPPSEPEFVDLSALGFNEGNEETAAFGVVEFSDFGCIHCATFHAESYPSLHEEFIASGDVLWKYVPISIAGFPNAELAGIAGECAGEVGSFAAMRDHLFQQREEWLGAAEGEPLFVEYARAVGLDPSTFGACLTGPDARSRMDRNNTMARQIGVAATPTFIVAGTSVQGAPPLANFQAALREMIAEARSAPAN